MKKILILGLMALLTACAVTAQTTYGNETFRLDTLSGTDNANYTLPLKYDTESVNAMASWQVRMRRLAGTCTYTIYYEESIDDASSNPDYVVVATIASGASVDGTTTELKYLYHAPVRGKKARLRVVHSGSGATCEIEVDCLVRKKQPLYFTDEF